MGKLGASYVNAASPGRLAAKEDVTSSTDTWNCWDNCTYAGATRAHSESATLVVKTLVNGVENKPDKQEREGRIGQRTLTASKSTPPSSTAASSSYKHRRGIRNRSL